MSFLAFPVCHFALSFSRGTGLVFDGVEERLRRTATVESTAATRRYATYSWWMRVASVGTVQPIFNAIYSDPSYASIQLDTSGRLVKISSFRHARGTASISVDEWTHYVIQYDSTQVDEEDRVKFWINGVADTVTYPGGIDSLNQSDDLSAVVGTPYAIGWRASSELGGEIWYGGDLALFHYVPGSVVAPTEFGETIDGVYQAKLPSPSFDTNGVFLPFADPAGIGDDYSGLGNDWTVSNMDATNLVGDGPYVSY